MKCEVKEITPEFSKESLEKVKNFRNPVLMNIDTMAADMRAGKWDENGESIKFNEKGELVDGQNRLMACMKADRSFTSVVVYGVRSDLNIDVGSKRQLHQWLRHHGVVKNERIVAAVLRSVAQVGRGWLPTSRGSCKDSNVQLVRMFKSDSEAFTSAANIANVTYHKTRWLPASVIATAVYLFNKKDKSLCESWIEAFRSGMIEGDALQANDPVFLLREKLAKFVNDKYPPSDRQKLALIILSWNHWRNGTTPKLLKWTESGPAAQKFPEVE